MYRRRLDVSRLVTLRAQRGWHRPEMARVSGVSLSMIKYVEYGQKIASDVTIAKLAKALDVELDDISTVEEVVIPVEVESMQEAS